MKRRRFFALVFLAIALAMVMQVAPNARAQEQEQDPPGRVARLNYSSGSVSFQPGGEGDWVTAVPNRPLTTGDNLWVDKGSRAELHIGSTAVRMDDETSLTFLDLGDQSTQLRLSAGSLIVRVRHLDDGDNFEIDTPNLAFSVLRTGEYRIDVNPDGNETVTTVWRGRGEVTGGGDSYTVIGGQQAHFTGTDNLDHEISQVPAPDDFVRWAFERDSREERAESSNYVSSEMTGYEDLDDYGRWHYVADYGPVWTPARVDPDWAPYRFGHWVWVAPWGWTWVEDEPWGFAPFHYGRWAYVESSWCWVPGPVVVRPVYAPALVAFVGGGGFHVGVAIGGGPGVAWFPLAPREVYVPWYRGSHTYINNVNISNTRVNVTQVTNVYNVYNTNTTNVTRITYVNQHVPTAVTVVSHDTFVNARPVRTNIVRVDEREVREAPVVREVAVQPSRASVIGAGRPVTMRPPERVVDRQVVVTHTPTPPRSFEERQGPTNVRVDSPHQPQPANQGPGQMQRPAPGYRRDDHLYQGGQPSQPTRDAPRPSNAERPVPPANDRQGGGREVQPNQPDRNVPRPQGDNGRVWVKPAPPVQDRPQQRQNEEQKFRNWDEQRQQHQQPPQPQPSHTQEQHAQPQPQHESAPRPPQHPSEQRSDHQQKWR